MRVVNNMRIGRAIYPGPILVLTMLALGSNANAQDPTHNAETLSLAAKPASPLPDDARAHAVENPSYTCVILPARSETVLCRLSNARC